MVQHERGSTARGLQFKMHDGIDAWIPMRRALGLHDAPIGNQFNVSPLDQSTECIERAPGLGSMVADIPERRLRPASGLCFGSRFLGGNDKRLLEVLPGSSFKLVRIRVSFWLAWLIDVCADHVDNRQAIFVEYAGGWLDAHFIDHGHLFGGPGRTRRATFALPAILIDVFTARYLPRHCWILRMFCRPWMFIN